MPETQEPRVAPNTSEESAEESRATEGGTRTVARMLANPRRTRRD